MVADAAQAMGAVFAAGGHIVLPEGTYGGEILGTFLDPAGGLLGTYQRLGLAPTETQNGGA